MRSTPQRLIADRRCFQDVFNQYYKRALAGRLLQDRSKSEALEHFFVNKIKVRCPPSRGTVTCCPYHSTSSTLIQ